MARLFILKTKDYCSAGGGYQSLAYRLVYTISCKKVIPFYTLFQEMSYPLGKLHQISFTAPITMLRSVIDVSSTEEVEAGCCANPEHCPCTCWCLLYWSMPPTIPLLSCYLTWSSLSFTFVLQRCTLLSLNKALCRLFLEANVGKSIWGQDS